MHPDCGRKNAIRVEMLRYYCFQEILEVFNRQLRRHDVTISGKLANHLAWQPLTWPRAAEVG